MDESSRARVGDERDDRDLAIDAARGGAVGLLCHVVGRGTEGLFQLVLARFLGLTQYGLFALGFTIYRMLVQFLLIGMENGVIRFGASYRAAADWPRLRGLVRTSFVLVATSGILGALVVFFVARPISVFVFNEPELQGLLRAMAIAIPFSMLLRVSAALLRSQQRIGQSVALNQVVSPLAKFVATGIAMAVGAELLGVGYAFAIGAGAALVVALVGVRTFIMAPVREAAAQRPIGLLGFSISTLLIGAAHIVLSQTDRLMLGILSSAAQVGLYNAAFVLASQTAIFLTAFNVAFAPMVADLHARKQRAEVESLYKSVTKWVLMMTLPAFSVLVIFGDSVLKLFGKGFSEGWSILAVLSAAQLVNAAVGGVGYLLIMTGHQWVEFWDSIAMMCFNIGLNYWLIRRYGAFGAGIATGVSLATFNVVRVVQVLWFLGFHPYRKGFLRLIPAVAAGVGIGLVVRTVSGVSLLSALGGIAAVGLVYVAVILSCGLEETDRAVVKLIRRKLVCRSGDGQ